MSPDKPVVFRVEGKPEPQPRHRLGYVQHGPKQGRPLFFLPKNHPVQTWKQLVTLRAREAWNGPVWQGPLRLDYLFIMPCANIKFLGGWLASKPDIDNLQKACQDALKGCVFEDDCQAVFTTATKIFARMGEGPCLWIRIQCLDEIDRGKILHPIWPDIF